MHLQYAMENIRYSFNDFKDSLPLFLGIVTDTALELRFGQ